LLMLRRQQRRRIGQELFWVCVGSVGMVALITILPSISADYGVLRAFQEALLVIAPVVVIGSMTIFSPLGKRGAQIGATAVCLGLFVATTGLVPQLLGGNLAELNLNNSGVYFDLYYMRPQDEAAVGWLGKQPGVLSYPIQAGYLQTKYLFTSSPDVNGAEVITDDFPTLIFRDSWLILGYPTVGASFAYAFTQYNGNVIEYGYPIQILKGYKDLVYNNGDTEIYK